MKETSIRARAVFHSIVFSSFILIILFLQPIFPVPAFGYEVENRLETELSWIDLGRGDTRLRENRFGELWHDGPNIETSLYSRLSLFDDRLTFVIEPILIAPRDGRNVYFRKGYVRGVLYNVALKVGRDSLWWGPGRHGTLVVSNNAFPFDLIELGSDQPFHLPWVLRKIGTFHIDTFLTQLERNRDIPHAKLFGLRIVYSPIERLAIGFTRVTQFGGDGRPGFTLLDFMKHYVERFKQDPTGKNDVNEIGSFDGQLTFPVFSILAIPLRTILYGEFGGEDEAHYLPSKHAWLVGIDLVNDSEPRWRGIIEYAQNHVNGGENSNLWYNHFIYTSGYTYRGEIIGHHMGHDSNDLYGQIFFPLLEKDRGDLSLEREESDLSLSDPSQMVRVTGGVEHFLHPQSRSVSFQAFHEWISPTGSQNYRNWGLTLAFRYRF